MASSIYHSRDELIHADSFHFPVSTFLPIGSRLVYEKRKACNQATWSPASIRTDGPQSFRQGENQQEEKYTAINGKEPQD